MADNVAITAGTGTTIAADDVGGVLTQRVKVQWGPDGTVNDADVATGKPLPVQHRVSDGTAWTYGSGTIAAGTPRVTLATDSPGVTALGQTTKSGSLPVTWASDQNPAHDAVDSVPPLKTGGYASAAAPTGVSADGDVVNAWRLRNGSAAVTITAAGALIPGDATTGLSVGGAIAHDGIDSGGPNKQGFKASTSLSGLTLVANADRTDGFAGIDGVQIVRTHTNLEDIVSGNATNTDGTATQCIAAQAAGIKTYLSSVVLCNTSATAITVDIKDGSTVKVSLPLPAGSGCIYNPPIPIPGTAATAWNFDGSAAASTVTCSMLGFKSKV